MANDLPKNFEEFADARRDGFLRMKELKDAIASKNVEDIKKKSENLKEVAYALAAKVYEQANSNANVNPENTTETTTDNKNDDVKDAEFEEK